MNTSPDIYNYTDVKKYLREYRDIRRKEDPGFSNTYICYVLGQKNSKGYFNNVISGRIKIGPTIIDRFQTLLSLSKNQFIYFRNLVHYSQARTGEERELYFRQLMKSSKLQGTEMPAQLRSYYSEWYHPMVRALTDLVDFDGSDIKSLHRKVQSVLSLPKLRNSVTLLIELGMIRKNDDGFYKPADAIITHGNDIEQEILLRYQEKVLNHGCSIVMDSNLDPQKITTMTLSISEEAYGRIEERMTELKHEVRAIANNDTNKAEKLCQIAIHLYPYTRRTS